METCMSPGGAAIQSHRDLMASAAQLHIDTNSGGGGGGGGASPDDHKRKTGGMEGDPERKWGGGWEDLRR